MDCQEIGFNLLMSVEYVPESQSESQITQNNT